MASPSISNMEALNFPKISFTNFNSSTHRTATTIRVNPQSLFLSSKILNPNSLISLRNLNFVAPISCLAKSSHSDHQHEHHHHHHNHHENHHHHNHGHNHGHGDGERDVKLTKSQEAFLKFANAIKWTQLANFLREHLELCCCSAALFVASAACPYLVPKPAVKPLQQVFTLIAFPLVGVMRFSFPFSS